MILAGDSTEMKQMSQYHLGSDHKGVLYSWSHRGHIDTSPPNRPLLHRAFKLKEVIE
jgi:hypothetical protein